MEKKNNQGQGTCKSTKVGSSSTTCRKINSGNGGGDAAAGGGELRRKTIMRRINVAAAEDVNDLADDFIKNFRKQLKLEREDSIKRFREMIDRGA